MRTAARDEGVSVEALGLASRGGTPGRLTPTEDLDREAGAPESRRSEEGGPSGGPAPRAARSASTAPVTGNTGRIEPRPRAARHSIQFLEARVDALYLGYRGVIADDVRRELDARLADIARWPEERAMTFVKNELRHAMHRVARASALELIDAYGPIRAAQYLLEKRCAALVRAGLLERGPEGFVFKAPIPSTISTPPNDGVEVDPKERSAS